MQKPTLSWTVAIRDASDELVRVAEVDGEGRASLLADALESAGVPAIHFKTVIDF